MAYDFSAAHRVLRELESFVLSEPLLADFLGPVREVCEQAQALGEGVTTAPGLVTSPPDRIPERRMAAEFVRILNQLPEFDPADEEEDHVRLVASLLANINTAVVRSIFLSYPDVVPREPT
jgi:hypothetical protein